jgi:hypothetical protein
MLLGFFVAGNYYFLLKNRWNTLQSNHAVVSRRYIPQDSESVSWLPEVKTNLL